MMRGNFLSTGAAARVLGVSTKTLRRWDAAGKFKPSYRTPGNHRRYSRRVLARMLRGEPGPSRGQAGSRGKDAMLALTRAAIYARVSSSKQKTSGDLVRQHEAVKNYCHGQGYEVKGVYTDVGSGMNDKRRALLKLLRAASRGRFDTLVVNYSDRLSRFGMNIIREFLGSWGVALEVIHPAVVDSSPHAELITDLTGILYSFMGRLYRMRRNKQR